MFVIINDEGTDIFAQQAREQDELTKYKAIFSSAGSNITFDEWRDVKCALGADAVNELVKNLMEMMCSMRKLSLQMQLRIRILL